MSSRFETFGGKFKFQKWYSYNPSVATSACYKTLSTELVWTQQLIRKSPNRRKLHISKIHFWQIWNPSISNSFMSRFLKPFDPPWNWHSFYWDNYDFVCKNEFLYQYLQFLSMIWFIYMNWFLKLNWFLCYLIFKLWYH